MISNKKFNQIALERFIKTKKTDYFYCFYCAVAKVVRLNCTQENMKMNMKIPNKWKSQEIAFNHSSDINFEDFMDCYKIFTA